VLVTAPGQYGGGHGVFFNGAGGGLETFGNVEQMSLLGVLGANATTLALKNPNLVPLDLDGDGSINLLHMPQTKTYASYAPVKTASGWQWQGQSIATADGLDARIDFGNDSLETQVMDVNFDGLVDVVLSSGSAMQTFFSLGRFPRGDGQFGNATMLSASAADLSNDPVETCLPWSSQPIRFSDPDVKVADMNGDGIADIVRARRGELRYWPGRGNGFWGTGNRGDCGSGAFGTGRHIEMSGAPYYSDLQGTSIRLEDVNGDGLTDLVQVRFDEVDVWLNVNGTSWTERRIIDHTPVSPSFASRVRLVDVDGSGTRDILWGDAGNYRYIDLQGGTRPWLLTQVHNGLGKTTSLEYATSADEMLAADAAGKPWTSRAPLVVQVVKRMTETDNLNVFGNGPRSYVTEYTYRDPVYDGRQREFRGFREATSRSIGDSNSPTSVARSELLMGECLYPSGAPCAVADQSYDNPHEALKGLPVLSETFDEQGVYLSTTLNQYTLRRLYQGLDGRGVAYAFQSGGSTWSYDTSNFIPSSSVLQGQSTVLAEGSGVGPSLVTSVPVRAQSGTVRTQGESEVDDFGNQLSSTSFGCVSGCPAGVDEAITGVTEPVLLNHPSGWLWRTGASYTVGSINTARRGETHTSFTPEGDPDRVTAVLTGTEALQRSHATGQTIAPIPGDAVADSPTLFVSQTEYDEFGNAIRSYAPGGRCADVFLDPLFGQLATTEIMYPGGCPGARSLSDPPADALYTAAAYDRGLELVTHVIDVSFQITQVEYDGLGRLVRLYRSTPDAATVGALPAVTIRYDLATPARPYSMVHTRSQDGAQPSSAAYMDSYAYVDGLGRTLVGITEADPGASDDGAWIAGGFMDYDRKGAVSKKYLPKFWDGNPEAFNLAATPDTAFGRVEYDAFGRDLRLYDLDGTQTLLNVYHPLSSDAWDAADSQRGGPHEGTYVTSVSDGHGRGVLGIERFKEGGSLIQRETRTSFLPTGEPLSITRSSVHGSTTRWLRYDSIGRMVLNVEPHTSTNFDPDPAADASNIRAWRYLYNASGELVATSDARGCGLNFAYDGVGRLLYEDYSPCEAGHQAYSPPSLGGAAPTGVEVYYQYDRLPSPALGTPEVPTGSGTSQQFTQYGSGEFLRGKLVAVFDRSKATWTNFDGRSRAWESWVQLAAPGLPDNALADRYLGRWYRKQVNFDAADRVVQETTGAQSPELQGADGESWVDIAYSGRGTVKSVGGSYGSLVTDIKRTADSLHEHIEYGDLAATRTQFAYDQRRRLSSVQTYRGPPSAWTNPPGSYMVPANPGQTTFQKVLQDDRYTYDIVSNPERIEDLRNPDEWPTGAKPVTRRMRYDDLYRVSRVDYGYAQGDDQVQNPEPAPSRMGPLGRRTTTAPRLSPKQLAALLAAVNTPGDPAPPRPPLKLSPKQLLPGVVPVVTAPIGQLHDSVPVYAWTPQVGATEYELRVDGPSGPVISERYSPTETGCAGASAECNQTPAVVLQPGSHTVWVRAHHQTQAGPWSAPEVFNVVAPLVDQDDGWEDPNSGLADARRAEPTPYQEFENRIRYQAWDYDWLGNTQQTDDDAKGFYDRSLGDIENGPLAGKAYQLQAADNRSSGSARQGALRTTYDVTGNLTEMRLDRDGTCIPSGRCSQIFRYEWDEVGRLVSAKRWDASSLLVSDTTPPTGVPDVELHYGYDASDMRVSKRAVDTLGEESWTLYLFNSLELRRTNWSTAEQDYALTPMTEVAYLFANGVRLARLAYEPPGDVPSINGENLHVFFELGDHLGSTSVVLDKATGELVERSTYQAYGGTESDYRPERWKSFREDYRFTGKEEDVEVGLIYFGKRFLNPLLNRWVSADPLAIHGLGADSNVYAYVSGRTLQSVDPLGLEGESKYDANEEAKFFGRTPETRKAAQGKKPARVAPRAAPKGAGAKGSDGSDARDQAGDKNGSADGTTSDPGAAGSTAQEASSGGGCVGPACGWNNGLGGEKTSSWLHSIANNISFLVDQDGPAAGGSSNGVPGGGCPSCKGSAELMVAVLLVRVIKELVPSIAETVLTMGRRILKAVTQRIDRAADLYWAAKGVPAGGPSVAPKVHAGSSGKGHTADWEHRGSDGRIKSRGSERSGADVPPGRRLTFNEQLNVHTEPKILKRLDGKVKAGDIITIRGTKVPCNPGGRGCLSKMDAFAREQNVKIYYEAQGKRFTFPLD